MSVSLLMQLPMSNCCHILLQESWEDDENEAKAEDKSGIFTEYLYKIAYCVYVIWFLCNPRYSVSLSYGYCMGYVRKTLLLYKYNIACLWQTSL